MIWAAPRARRGERTAAADRARLEAYARGVNAGLASLGARPWEYFLLRQSPAPWRAVDTLHVVHAMMRDLQRPMDRRELSRPLIEKHLVAAVADVVMDPTSPFDAPIVDDPTPRRAVVIPADGPERASTVPGPAHGDVPDAVEGSASGSNSFAVGGAFTEDGRAMLANDMHLSLSVPVIWYAMRMVVEGDDPLDAVGVSLPGAPAIVVGSNGSIAWGFTNSYGDWVDHVRLEIDPDDATRYRTPDGWRAFDERIETIDVAGGAVDTLVVRETIWGPQTVEVDGVRYATRWVGHAAEAVDLNLARMMEADDLESALDLAARCGVPHQNLVVADADGRLGWTLIGRVPRRVGLDGGTAHSWADGSRGWRDGLGTDEVPAPRLRSRREDLDGQRPGHFARAAATSRLRRPRARRPGFGHSRRAAAARGHRRGGIARRPERNAVAVDAALVRTPARSRRAIQRS